MLNEVQIGIDLPNGDQRMITVTAGYNEPGNYGLEHANYFTLSDDDGTDLGRLIVVKKPEAYKYEGGGLIDQNITELVSVLWNYYDEE